MVKIDWEALENRIHRIFVAHQNEIKQSLLAEMEAQP